MNYFKRIIIFVAAVLTNLQGQNSAVPDSFIVAKMEQYHFPGLQATIIKDDKIIWKGNYGYADIEQNKLITDSTLFTICSVSKVITATAIMQIWEQGLFELDDDVNNYLPFTVRNPNHPNIPITFRMLLTHTSSISRDGIGGIYYETPGGDSPIALGYFLENFLVPGGIYYYDSNWRTWTPGTQWDYTDASAAILGYLVETITNISFEQYCQDSLFIPLGMTEVSWFLANLDINHIAIPYTYSGANYIPYGHTGDPVYPAGQLRTSAVQLSHFISAYIQKGQFNGVRILNSSTIDSITTVQYPAIRSDQGLIWFLSKFNIPDVGERDICQHLGGWTGASALIGYILGTGENIGAVILANNRNDNGIVEIGLQLLSYGVIITDIEKESTGLPTNFFLSQNWPNPFNPITKINYELPITYYVDLSIYNLLGQIVATLVDKKQPAGSYQVEWDASGFASGIYIYRLKVQGQKQNAVFTKKLVLLK